MARPSKLASMSVEALLQLRDDIGSVLSRKAGQLQTQLAALRDGGWISRSERPLVDPREEDEGPQGSSQVPQPEEPV